MTNAEQRSAKAVRPPYRPPIGIPTTDGGDNAKGALASLIVHGVLILLLVLSTRTPPPELFFDNIPTGAGGINLPAGGGGGGTLGAGGRPTIPERAQFIQVAPQPVAKQAVPEVKPPEVRKPTPEPIKPPEVKPPDPVVVPPPIPDTKVIAAVATAGTIDSTMTGRGGGSGSDGSAGNGPGTGGGIGSGDGTGRGSGTGPGTGGGSGNVYQPSMTITPFIPEPPDKLRPFELVAVFDVDSTGVVKGIKFNKSGDRGYDRALDAALKLVKFRPAVDLAGRPVRAPFQLVWLAK